MWKKNFNVIASYRSKTDVIDLEQQGIKCLHLDMRDTKSINSFYSQEELVTLIKKNGFSNVKYRNLSSGISAIHSGWKV